MFLMKDITRDGNPVLRKRAAKVEFPLSAEDRELARQLMEYLEISQDEELCKKYGLRAGVGLAAALAWCALSAGKKKQTQA